MLGLFVAPSPQHAPSAPKRFLLTPSPIVRRILLDNLQARTLRQRRLPPPALGRNRQRQLGQGGKVPGRVEAPSDGILLHVRKVVDCGQELLGPHCYVGGEERAGFDAGVLLEESG